MRVPNRDTTLPNPDPTKPRVFVPANVGYVPLCLLRLWSCSEHIHPKRCLLCVHDAPPKGLLGTRWYVTRSLSSFRVADTRTTAEYFDPDRWIDERLNKYFASNPFIFLPFNAGPRICLGQQVRTRHRAFISLRKLTMSAQFAYNEMSFFLIRLLQNFSHMELDLSAQPPEARPPPEWVSAEGQKGVEKIVPKAHLTLYIHVSAIHIRVRYVS